MTPDLAAGDARSCSESAAQAGEPLAGTAPLASVWLVIEQHGSYGAKALLESGLPVAVGAGLSGSAWSGVKVILARPSGRHIGDRQPAKTRVWIAHPASGQLVSTLLGDSAELLALDPQALIAGELPSWDPANPQLFVCTNGKRDVCCARWGRRALAEVEDLAVWECSHLGGHRFAATGVLLPWGYVYGRLDGDSVRAVMASARAGHIRLTDARGRSCLSPAAQCADLHLRAVGGFEAPSEVVVLSEHQDSVGQTVVELRTPTAATTAVNVAATTSPRSIPASCGATAEPHVRWRVVGTTATA